MTDPDLKKVAEQLTKQLADNGRLVEAGWAGFMLATKLTEATAAPGQLSNMRKAFFAGAMHLFTSMLSFLEAGTEPTDTDLKRMDALSKELERFQKEFEAQLKQRN